MASRFRGNDGIEVKSGIAPVGATVPAANPSLHKMAYLLAAIALLITPALANAATSLPDPTRPSWRSAPTRSAPVVTRFELASILIADDRRIAIINGQTVGVGGIVDGAVVLLIDANAVTLRRNGEEMVLTLLPAGIKS